MLSMLSLLNPTTKLKTMKKVMFINSENLDVLFILESIDFQFMRIYPIKIEIKPNIAADAPTPFVNGKHMELKRQAPILKMNIYKVYISIR